MTGMPDVHTRPSFQAKETATTTEATRVVTTSKKVLRVWPLILARYVTSVDRKDVSEPALCSF